MGTCVAKIRIQFLKKQREFKSSEQSRAETFGKAGEKESLNDNQGQRTGGHEAQSACRFLQALCWKYYVV